MKWTENQRPATPTLTIVALALRQSEYIADQMSKGAI